ncbi:MAG: hypothetical protein GKS06_07525 [Acidobacteria bacterium]|nr:hypothetical protein [Acidobacteriota bacterium]
MRNHVAASLLAALLLWQEPVKFVFPADDTGLAGLAIREAQQMATADSLGVHIGFEFIDRIEASGITFVHRAVADSGRDYRAVHYDHGNSVSVADVDSDGLLDLYFVNQIGSNELWRNLGGMRFENITVAAGVGLADRIGVAASFADVDNDGDPDLFVTSVRGGNALFENTGEGRFFERTIGSGLEYSGHSSGAVFIDFDLDGRLDLFVSNVGDYTTDDLGDGGYYVGLADAFEGHLDPQREEPSRLYRNAGNWRFEDVTAEAGLVDLGWNGDAALVDLDGNALPDLYVLNMQGDDHYMVNRGGGRFVDETFDHFAKTPYGAMGIASADFDNDGDQDVFITDMHSDMNAAQGPDEEHLKQRLRYMYQDGFRHLMGNAFYRQSGTGFVESSDEMGAENYWPWGLSAEDINADGWTDVFISSSMNYPFRYQTNAVRLNVAGQRFAPAEFILGIEPRRDGRVRQPWFELDCGAAADGLHEHCSGRTDRIRVLGTLGTRSSALVDLDADGDLDVVTAEFNSAPQLLVSDLAQRGQTNWLAVSLQGDAANRDGLGATVTVTAGDTTYTQVHDGKSGYLAQSSVPLYFGLGHAANVERVEVIWPGGRRQTLEGPIVGGRQLRIVEPS